jgi:cytidylate kinase
MMAVITISREVGSQGDSIAKQIVQSLDYHLVDKDFIGRVLSQYGLVEFGKEYEALPGFWDRFNAQREKRRDLMVEMLNRVIKAVAQHGNVVILGRSGFAILGDFVDVLNIRIWAPLPVRVKRVMEQQHITAPQAEGLIRENDQVRASFIQSFYGIQWQDIRHFDMIVNTNKISSYSAVLWLVEAARLLDDNLIESQPVTASIQVDDVLSTAIKDTLNCDVNHRKLKKEPI